MITINLKAKHYRLIAQLLKGIVIQDVFRIVKEIQSKVTSTYADDDPVSVDVYPNEISYVYPLLSILSEGEAAEINKEMDYMLRPQIETGIGNNDAEWVEVGTKIQEHKQRMQQSLQARIDEGRQFLEQWT